MVVASELLDSSLSSPARMVPTMDEPKYSWPQHGSTLKDENLNGNNTAEHSSSLSLFSRQLGEDKYGGDRKLLHSFRPEEDPSRDNNRDEDSSSQESSSSDMYDVEGRRADLPVSSSFHQIHHHPASSPAPSPTASSVGGDSTNGRRSGIVYTQPFTPESTFTGNGHRCGFPGCSKIAKDKKTLRKHLLTHREKQFICEFEGCNKKFYERAKLKRHLIVHSGEKPYVCEHEGCGKRFGYKANLKTHQRTHTGIKPFMCTIPGCNRRFAQASNRNSHVLTHQKDFTQMGHFTMGQQMGLAGLQAVADGSSTGLGSTVTAASAMSMLHQMSAGLAAGHPAGKAPFVDVDVLFRFAPPPTPQSYPLELWNSQNSAEMRGFNAAAAAGGVGAAQTTAQQQQQPSLLQSQHFRGLGVTGQAGSTEPANGLQFNRNLLGGYRRMDGLTSFLDPQTSAGATAAGQQFYGTANTWNSYAAPQQSTEMLSSNNRESLNKNSYASMDGTAVQSAF